MDYTQSGQAILPPLKHRQKGLVPASATLRVASTSTLSSSARQTFPTAVPSVGKDCFGLHSDSAFGFVAQKKSGIGQQSVIPLRSTTASPPTLLIRSSRARLWPSSADATEVHRLASTSALPRMLSYPAAPSLAGTHFGPQRPWCARGGKRCAAETDVRKRPSDSLHGQRLLCVGCAATEETTAASAAGY